MLSRRVELSENLAAVRARVGAACAAAGRDPAGVTLIAVTKTWPASDVVDLAGLGVRDVGENRDQEAAGKARDCAAAGVDDLRWHFVGRLQTNKCRSVATYADVVHSLDRPGVIEALSEGAGRAGRTVGALVQVDLGEHAGGPVDGGAGGRGGAAPSDVLALADAIAAAPNLRLLGVMAVAPLGAAPRPAFARLAEIAAGLRVRHPDATWISAGMTADLAEAVEMGATHVRVGSGLLGARAPLG